MQNTIQKTCTVLLAILFLTGLGLSPAQAQLQKVEYDLEAQTNDGAIPDGVDATATFWEYTENQTIVTLELDGDSATGANVSHPAHIHNNSASEGGGIAVYLTPIDGSGGGGTSARVVNQPFDSLTTFDGYINIHESVENLGNVVSQGNIGANADSTAETGLDPVDNPRSAQYDLAANSNDGAIPDGVPGEATFQELTSSLTLVSINLTIDGATGANVSHPAHIHNNSANEGGSIEYYLSPVAGDDSESRSSKLVAESFDTLEGFDGYINVHESVANLGNVVAQGNIGSNVGVAPPSSSFELVASQSDLNPEGGNPDAQCIDQFSGTYVFFNSTAPGIYTWDGSSLGVHTDSTALNDNIDATSNVINRCDAIEIDGDGNVYFSFRASDDPDQPNYIYKTNAADPSINTFTEIDGTVGLSVYNSTLYLASYEFFEDTGNREDGIYSIGTDLSGSPSEVAIDPDLSIDGGIDISESGVLYGYSNDFAGGNFAKKIVSLDVTASSPSFQIFSDPYASGSPLTGGDVEIADLNTVTFGGNEYVVVHNPNSGASSGEEFGAIRVSDQSISVLFTEGDLIDNLGVPEYSAAFARPITVNSSGEVTVASGGGGATYLASANETPPLPVEMAGFDAVQTGSSVELTWQTASETNNAGFTVQRETESGWASLDFVESKVSGGTTTETTSYRYTVDQELDPGTHRFRLQQKDLDGTTSLSDVVTVDVGLDEAVSLSAPAPNPTMGTATLEFGVKTSTEVTVSVYNVLGQRVKTLYQGTPQAEQVRDVTVDAGSLPSGVYFVRLQADGQTRTERLTVVR
jgi:hypothetical protein